ncbi:MAG: VanZ family protein [Chthoniobacterales bacterium]
MKSRFVRYWLPVLGWMLLIFSASTDVMSAESTSRFVTPFLRWLTPDISSAGIALAHFFIRKAAHVTEYAILAMLLWRAVRHRPSEGREFFWPQAGIVLLSTTAYAGLDEFHQVFVFSRTGSIRDVMIDGSGAFLAIFVCWLFVRGRAAREMDAHETSEGDKTNAAPHRLARITIVSLLLAFIGTQTLTIFAMSSRISGVLSRFPRLPGHFSSVGIVSVAAIAGLLLFKSLSERLRKICAAFYGGGLALIVRAYSMRLEGTYWRRAVFDGLVLLVIALGVIAFAPIRNRMRSRDWVTAAVISFAVIAFYALLLEAVRRAGMRPMAARWSYVGG